MKNYDPKLVVVTFAGIQIQGYAAGTFVRVEREVDAYSKEAGSAGDVTRVRSRNRSGSVTVTLQAEAPTNDLLTVRAKLDELSNAGSGALMVKNINGTTICQAKDAWIRKMPNVEYADAANPREWVLDCAELNMTVGGATI